MHTLCHIQHHQKNKNTNLINNVHSVEKISLLTLTLLAGH